MRASVHRVSRERRTKPKFMQPEVRPTPAGRTDLSSFDESRDRRQHRLTRVRALRTEVSRDPVVIGPRTDESVRPVGRLGKPVCLILSDKSGGEH